MSQGKGKFITVERRWEPENTASRSSALNISSTVGGNEYRGVINVYTLGSLKETTTIEHSYSQGEGGVSRTTRGEVKG